MHFPDAIARTVTWWACSSDRSRPERRGLSEQHPNGVRVRRRVAELTFRMRGGPRSPKRVSRRPCRQTKEINMRGVILDRPGRCGSRTVRTRRSSSRPMPSSGWPPPAYVVPICGPTAASTRQTHMPMGHEYVGTVTEIGDAVSNIAVGDFVVGSFFASDNTCEICRAGYQSRCVHAVPMGAIGTQAEYARVPLADGTLVPTPGPPDPTFSPRCWQRRTSSEPDGSPP